MRDSLRSTLKSIALVAVLSGTVLAQGCALDFSGDNFQRFRVFFSLTEALVQGEATLVHVWFFPTSIKVRKRWVQISGKLTTAGDEMLPSDVTVVARFEDVDTGKQQSKVSIKVRIDDDGSFSASKKLKKNISANSMMVVTIEPSDNDLPEDTELALCVDLVEKKSDVNSLPVCVEEEEEDDGGDGGDQAVTLSELQTSLFTFTCALIGCHSGATASAGLVLEAGRTFSETVNVPSSQVASFDIIEPGDPERSYMIKKLRGDADIQGLRMPRFGPFLTDEEIGQVISWVNAGALDN